MPWRDPGLLAILLVTAAIPSLLLAAGAAWEGAAQDQIAARFDDRSATVSVESEVRFTSRAMAAADEAVVEQLLGLDGFHAVDRISTTLPGLGSVDTTGPRVPVRVTGRADVAQTITIAEGELVEGGSLISTWLADHAAVGIGDTLRYEAGETGDLASNDVVPGGGTEWTVTVTGFYEPLWTEDDTPPPSEWTNAGGIVPRFVSPIGRPNFALVLVDEQALWASGLDGFVTWRGDGTPPDGWDGYRERQDEFIAMETALATDADLVARLDAATVGASGTTRVVSDFGLVMTELGAAIGLLEDPIRAANRLGLVIGLSAALGTGVIFADRRRHDLRLLSDEGAQAPALAARAAAQLAAPVAVGAAIGAVAGLGLARWQGPATDLDIGALDSRVLGVSVAALVIAAVIVGGRGQLLANRRIGSSPTRAIEWAVVALTGALAVALWLEVGASAGGVSSGIAVVTPLVLLAAVTGAVLLVVDLLLRRRPGFGTGWPTTVFLAIRRIATDGGTLRLATGAVAIGLGLVTYATLTIDAVDRAVDARAVTTVGAETRLDLFGEVPAALDLPDGSTQILVQDTQVVPGRNRMRVIAIDEATFASLAPWPASFGTSAAQVLEDLGRDTGSSIAAIAVTGEDGPDTAAFGTRTLQPFTVVRRVDSLPLASEFGSTILVSAARLDEVAAARAEAADPGTSPPRPPTTRFRSHILSDLTPAELEPALADAGLTAREVHTIADVARSPDVVAIRTSLDYQRVLGGVAGAMAALGIVTMIGAQRTRRRHAHVMIGAMGFPTSRLALVTALEVGLAVVLIAPFAVAAAGVAAHRLFPGIDPSGNVPPPIDVGIPLSSATTAAGFVVGATLLAWLADAGLGRSTTTLDDDAR